MPEYSVNCPKQVFIDHNGSWNLSENPYENIININGRDFVMFYLHDGSLRNKGGNSNIFRLFDAQNFDEDDISIPDLIIKISNSEYRERTITKRNKRFINEIKALQLCNDSSFQNVIRIFHNGKISVVKKGFHVLNKTYLFYTMEYAETDLKEYIENHPDLTLFEKTDFCLQIAKGIQELNNLGFFHRDIKPDNIFVINETWKIGDLGLISSRQEDYMLDSTNELIGPRGWFCPEAMNKHLTMNKKFHFEFDCIIDHQSDIFQLGKIFWYIFQGNTPTGSVRRNDFMIKDERIYSIIRRMINQSKCKRFPNINEIIALLKPIHKKYLLLGD